MEVWVRFGELNNCITVAIAGRGGPRLSQLLLDRIRWDDRRVELRQIRHAHAALHRAAELLQRHLGTTVALAVANAFWGGIYSSYGLLVLCTVPKRTHASVINRSVWLSLFWVSLNAVRLSALAVCCSATCDRAESALVLVQRSAAMTPAVESHAGAAELAALQSQVAATPRLAFTAAGFLTVDRRLLVTVLSATVTYLVILGQIATL
ncbi:uncharacterized protein LOC126455906 [Schistocerca serialis cubense]|uniref:uncharacterized protein LOC126455906 n=1 Tax=Schistocerca serialis cubense TaxID=2023355 RepID=UPI00214E8D4F|nr:uncharacterized protein LOC126455906 [Schistocerca serialis cubense]